MFLKKRQQTPSNRFYRLDTTRVANEPRRRQVYDYYREPPAQRTMSRAYLVMGIIAIFLIGQSIFQVPWLALSHVTIEGLPDIPREQLDQRINPVLQQHRWLIFKNSNFLLFKSGKLQQQLTDDFWLKNVIIRKQFPNTLHIKGEERILPFVRQTPEAFTQLDYRGQQLGDLASTTIPTNVVIADERSDRSQWISTDYLEKASAIRQAWNFPTDMITISKFHLNDDDRQLIVSTSRGYRVLFSSSDAFGPQIQRLRDLLDQNVIPATIQYVDLRFGDHVYFK